MRIAAIMMMTVVLAGCATAPAPMPKTVEVPVSVACKPVLSPEPDYVDTDEALERADGLFDRVKLLVAGRLQRIAREAELQAAVDGCSK